MKYDFVGIGDVTTDCFIKLHQAEIHCKVDNSECEICMPFGRKIPYESATEVWATGNSSNAALCVAKLGLSAALVSSVGGDENGKKIMESLQSRNVATEYMTVHADMKTNYYYILQYGAERTILVKHHPYPKVIPAFAEPPKWLYFSAAGDNDFQNSVGRYCTELNVKLAFQPNTEQINAGHEALKDVYAASEIFICNKEEAQTILKTEEKNEKKLMEGIRALGPKIVVVTDGPNGANILDESGAWPTPMYPDPAPPVSRTGAGDVTASTAVAYLIKGFVPKDALVRALINAAAGVQAIHAQLGTLTETEIEEWYARRPADFVLSPLS
jgi:ribokinase